MPYLERPGFRLYYCWDGDDRAPVLMLSHSLGADQRMWEPQVEMLQAQFHILRYDHPGHGASDLRPHRATIADFGADALALMDHLSLERVHFCGLSLGGMVALWLGAYAPQRLRRLVVSSATAHFEDTSLLRGRIARIRSEGRLEGIAESVLGVWFTPAFRERERDKVTGAREMFLTTNLEGYAATAETVCDLDLRGDLARISAPVLVLYGAHDPATLPTLNRALVAAIPGARGVCLEGAHLVNFQAAADYGRLVREFLLADR